MDISGKNKNQNALSERNGERTIITKEMMVACCKRVVHYLQTEKRYTQPSYSLWELAHESGMTTKLISASINAYMGQDFYELMGRMRVEEAKRLLRAAAKAAEKVSVDEIGTASGFNSRSTFFACFKKYAGMTPGKYMILSEENK